MRKLATGVVGVTVLCSLLLPPGSADAQRGPNRRGGMMVRTMLPLEGTIGFLAFDEKMAVRDDQLVAIRAALKDVHAKRAALVEEMRGGADRQAMRGKIQSLRTAMIDQVKGVLDDSQDKLLDDYLKQIQEMRRRFQQGGGRRGGGGGAM